MAAIRSAEIFSVSDISFSFLFQSGKHHCYKDIKSLPVLMNQGTEMISGFGRRVVHGE
jgi:hypothetical protein